MSSYKITAITAGLGLLLTMALSVSVNMFLLGPVVFDSNFLTTISANENQVKMSALLELLNGILSIGIVMLFLPLFFKHNKSLSLGYLGFAIFHLAVVVLDVFNVFSMLSLSKEYINVAVETEAYFQLLGTVLYDNRWWSHYMEILSSCFPLLLFYVLLFQTKLVPRFISIWGLVAVPLVITSVLLAMFDQGTHMSLMMVLGLNQIFMIFWLIIKGFTTNAKESTMN
jgi:hypothetical protein